ncbi:MAG TPA: DUF5667 domain-containing protein, partial [Anaerolineaceae bacterium]|nr:DUF5667 domain-containing protein [Anaerolineaceae bacterium]
LKVDSLKTNFMNDARMIQSTFLTSSPKRTWWNHLFQKKETFSMKLITVFTILGLLLGGGITAVAAQDSLPGDILYPIKTLVEDIEIGLATKPETQFQIASNHANKRFSEIQELIEQGELPPEPLFYSWQSHLETALRYALQTGDPSGNLMMVQQMLQQQTMMMNKGDSTNVPIMNTFMNALKFQQGLVEAGIEEPENLANELEFMFQYQQQLGKEEGEDLWQNLYQEQMQSQNAGEDQNFEYQWMFSRSEFNDGLEPPQYNKPDDPGANNSYNDHPNGGNSGENDQGNNQGDSNSGGSNGGSGGK